MGGINSSPFLLSFLFLVPQISSLTMCFFLFSTCLSLAFVLTQRQENHRLGTFAYIFRCLFGTLNPRFLTQGRAAHLHLWRFPNVQPGHSRSLFFIVGMFRFFVVERTRGFKLLCMFSRCPCRLRQRFTDKVQSRSVEAETSATMHANFSIGLFREGASAGLAQVGTHTNSSVMS